MAPAPEAWRSEGVASGGSVPVRPHATGIRSHPLERVVADLPIGVVLLDAQGRIAFANREAESVLGLERSDEPGHTHRPGAWRVVDPDSGEPMADPFSTAAVAEAGGTISDHRVGLVGDDHSVRVLACNATCLDEDGRIVGAVATVEDITERHERERTAALLSSLVTAAATAITSETLDGTVTSWNPAAEEIFGRAATEMLGAPYATVVPEDRRQEREDLLQQVRQGRRVTRHETMGLRRNGEPFPATVTLSPVVREDGTVVAVSTITRDATEEVGLRSELERQAEELSRSNLELQQFASVAAHDLQEPLRMIHSFVQLLSQHLEGQLDDQAREYMAFAVDGATRMQALIRDLLEWSRVATRARDPVACDLEAVLLDVVNDLQLATEEAGVEIVHGPLPTVLVDPTQAGQLLGNLLRNAIKFRHPDRPATVEVTAGRDGDEWRISVADNGIGIPPDQTERVFAIFQRLHGRDAYPGTGIGLAICQRIVERHGGQIHARSRSDGTTIEFTLPSPDGPPASARPLHDDT